MQFAANGNRRARPRRATLCLVEHLRAATRSLCAPHAPPADARFRYRRRGGNSMTRQLCIAVHDVAPATWPQCEALLDMLDAFGAPRVTLLVVPDWHSTGRIDAAPQFIAAIERRRARGDEIALHGYFHRDDSPAPRGPSARLRRRVLTAGEGEFADLPCDIAEARLRL